MVIVGVCVIMWDIGVVMEVVVCDSIGWIGEGCVVVCLWRVCIGVMNCSYLVLGVSVVMSVWVGVVVLGVCVSCRIVVVSVSDVVGVIRVVSVGVGICVVGVGICSLIIGVSGVGIDEGGGGIGIGGC